MKKMHLRGTCWLVIWGNDNLLGKKYIGTELKHACNNPQKNVKQTKFFWVVLNLKANYQNILKLSYLCHLNYEKKVCFPFMSPQLFS